MAFGKEENEAIRQIVAEEIQDILRREFSDLKASIQTAPDRNERTIKPKKVGRTPGVGYERGAPGTEMGQDDKSGNPQSTRKQQGDSPKANQNSGNRGKSGKEPAIGPTVSAAPGRSRRGKRGERSGNATTESRNSGRGVKGLSNQAGVQQAARALAEAQFELSQELQRNLRTLKDVILHSQDIARRIQIILGKADAE